MGSVTVGMLALVRVIVVVPVVYVGGNAASRRVMWGGSSTRRDVLSVALFDSPLFFFGGYS